MTRCRRSKYSVPFFIIGGGFVVLALTRGGAWWLAVWPGASFLIVAGAYAFGAPAWFGKRADGRMAMWPLLALGPYVAFAWVAWHAARLLERGPAGHEVAPGVWVGRRPSAVELPAGVQLVVDLTCEMWVPRGVVATGRAYVCCPTLDGTAPNDDAAIRELLKRIDSAGGPVYIHCAQGRGRSAAVAAVILVVRDVVRTVGEAESILAAARPGVRLNDAQRRWARRFIAEISQHPSP